MRVVPARLWVMLCPILLLAGCLGGQPVAWQDPAIARIWPEPPEKPRIRFLRTLSDASDLRAETRSSQLFRWISGENEELSPLVSPYGITADGEGRIWVADAGTLSVHLFDLRRGRFEKISAAGDEAFASPVGVAYDAKNRRLYVSDSSLGKVFLLEATGGLLGYRQPPGGFGRPGGMTIDDAGNLYVADVVKGKIEVFSPEGGHLKSLGSTVAPGGRFNRPSNVAVDGKGQVFVTDSMNFRVEVLAGDEKTARILGSLGDTPGAFARPRGVAVDSEGHVYVTDAAFDNIQVFDSAGALLLHFGRAGRGPGEFNLPAGIFIDQADRLYVVDAMNRRIQIFQFLR